jgi:hypothetical protein
MVRSSKKMRQASRPPHISDGGQTFMLRTDLLSSSHRPTGVILYNPNSDGGVQAIIISRHLRSQFQTSFPPDKLHRATCKVP